MVNVAIADTERTDSITTGLASSSEISAKRYEPVDRQQWDDLISRSKNGVFLFLRDYMEYHADRFTDHSLIFLNRGQVLAALPANLSGQTLVSHGGLTFGGIISADQAKAETMLEIFEALIEYARSHEINRIIYKAIPHIYHRVPAEEDLYALYRFGGVLFRRDLSSTIEIESALPFSKGRKWAIKQADKHGLEVKQSSDFQQFMTIESHVLGTRYGLKPVHTATELGMLAARFPDNIKLFVAQKSGEMLGGVVIYESQRVAHAQYISATDEGKRVGAIDAVLNFLLTDYYRGKRYFDFGISTEDNGRYLNQGLIANKEGFGARGIAYDFYEIKVN